MEWDEKVFTQYLQTGQMPSNHNSNQPFTIQQHDPITHNMQVVQGNPNSNFNSNECKKDFNC
jgi:hypothetical protein